MFSLPILILFFSTQIHSQNITVRFPTITANADLGPCTCDLTIGYCDPSCCCDADCSAGDRQIFSCSSRANEYTNSTPVYSSIQANCFKNLSVFYSDTPYVVEKAGELVCIDYARSSASQYYQQPKNDNLDPATFIRLINAQDNVNPSATLPSGFNSYQVGTPLLRNSSGTNSRFFSLPKALLRNGLCSGYQAISYMNDFTSTCTQLVSVDTCSSGDVALNSARFNNFCLQRNPSDTGSICANFTGTNAVLSGSSCSEALKSLIITITYSNPTGISNIDITSTRTIATVGQPFEQNYFVRFVKTSSSLQSNATTNPGFLPRANIVAGYSNGSQITTLSSSRVSLLKGSTSGVCDSSSSSRIEIRFGENVRSACVYNVANSNACANETLPLLTDLWNVSPYVAAYSIYDPANISSDWLPVISCTSPIGSPDSPECLSGPLFVQAYSLCYVRLDIQIAFTKIGSYLNPQSILSAVIFNYQTDARNATGSSIFLSSSVTYVELNNTPVVEVGIIPPPNTRLPADFFYPFTSSATTNLFSFLFVFMPCVLMFTYNTEEN